MLTPLTAALAGLGVAAAVVSGGSASAAVADAATAKAQRQTANVLAEQFDASAPHFVLSDHFEQAMALRRKARANYRHGDYGKAITELRTALNDIRTLPLPYAGVPPPKKAQSFPGLNADSG